jgi:adenosylcobinamide-GDP ribazoletransferase
LIVIASHAFSRWCAIALIWKLPYVRGDVESKSKPMANSLNGLNWLWAGIIGVAPIVLIALTMGGLIFHALLSAALWSCFAGMFAGFYFKKHLGGYTGDCLVATQQCAEVSFYLGALAVLNEVVAAS